MYVQAHNFMHYLKNNFKLKQDIRLAKFIAKLTSSV